MKIVAIADLLEAAAANPEIAAAVIGLAILGFGTMAVVWSLIGRCERLEQELDARTVFLGREIYATQVVLGQTRATTAKLAGRVKRLRDERGRFVKKPKLHEAA